MSDHFSELFEYFKNMPLAKLKKLDQAIRILPDLLPEHLCDSMQLDALDLMIGSIYRDRRHTAAKNFDYTIYRKK